MNMTSLTDSTSLFPSNLAPQATGKPSPQGNNPNSTLNSQQAYKKYCSMLASNTYFLCSPRHHTHYTRGVIAVSNTTEYLKHQGYDSFCMNVSYLNTMCYSQFAIPIFKAFWVSSPFFDSPFTVPPAYIHRYASTHNLVPPLTPAPTPIPAPSNGANGGNGNGRCLTMQINNTLFSENKYPLPIIVPQNLSKISTPSPTSSKLSLQFSSSNQYYFNHATHQTCICQSILEPSSVDITLLYILRTTFNTIYTEKIKSQYPNALHSFAISFNGQHAINALLLQHAIVTSEKEAIGLLTRLLHLNLIAKLDQLQAHFTNQKKPAHMECDHVKPLPSFSPSADYVISLQIQDTSM